MATHSLIFLLLTLIPFVENARSLTISSKLIHRFSDEAKAIRISRKGAIPAGWWPMRRSMEYYRILVSSDFKRQELKLGAKYNSLFPLEGSEMDAVFYANDYGWLHYIWIDIGTPNVSYLVALDTESDLFWVPCDCIQCASLSASHYNLDRDLRVYSPSESSTSKHLSCSHELCSLSPNCKSPKQPCTYTVNYYSENTSSSGLLVEDTLYLASGDEHTSASTVKAPVIIGCGQKQSGGYLQGIAPDGLLGLGFGDMSVPSSLSKAGLVRNSFSMCFDEDGSGRIFFGDLGSSTQQSTPFLKSDGSYLNYVVGVDGFCIGTACPEQTGFQALVDSGSSFTFLPGTVYDKVVAEFDKQMNAPRVSIEESPWEYCYKASSPYLPKIPTVTLRFVGNSSFEVQNPIFRYDSEGELAEFCLAIQSARDDLGTIGQNLMAGYRIVFNREKLKLGWSHSHCRDIDDGTTVPLTPPPHDSPENPLPTNEQQSNPGGNAVSPAVAGRTPTNPSVASPLVLSHWFFAIVAVIVSWSSHPSFLIG